MMFDYNPWSSLFLLQAIHMDKPRHEAAAKRNRSVQISQGQTPATATIAQPTKLPPPHRAKASKAPRRGWRDAFRRTTRDRAEAAVTSQKDAAV